jgi:hypothetical protein
MGISFTGEENDMPEWIKWVDKQPREGEAGYVIFYNRVGGKCWMNKGSIVIDPYWDDNVPVLWAPKPEMPEVKPSDIYEANEFQRSREQYKCQ